MDADARPPIPVAAIAADRIRLSAAQADPHFTQPVRQIAFMLAALAAVGVGLWWGRGTMLAVYRTNPPLNTAILVLFVLGVLGAMRQVWTLVQSVSWIETFARQAPGESLPPPPSLLAPLAQLLRTRGARMQLTSSSTRSILESVVTRVDEDQDITRYIAHVMILLGLLGTFYGLATTVPALVDTIRSLSPGEGDTGSAIFERLQQGLETQLGGMGTAFSSSLLGLGGSLVVGLLELFAGHGQSRFTRELEEWLSSMTRVGLAEEGGTTEGGVVSQVIDHLSEQIESLQMIFAQSDVARAATDRRLGELTAAIGALGGRLEAADQTAALSRVADGQERLLAILAENAETGGPDAESRIRLRSIEVQLLRILEEISAGRQETLAELRQDLTTLGRSLRGGGARGPEGGA